MKFFIGMLIILFCSCKNKTEPYFTLKGHIDSLHTKKMYVVQAARFEIPLDSFSVVNGNFEYRKHWKKGEEPFLASLMFTDSLTGKLKTIDFFNPVLSDFVKDSPIFVTNAFMLGKENIEMHGKVTQLSHLIKSDSVFLTGSRQTDAYFEVQIKDFGFLTSSEEPYKTNQERFYKQLIKKYPLSYFYLDCISDNKESYTNKELEEFLHLFNKELQLSNSGKEITRFIETRNISDTNNLNFMAYTPVGKREKVIDTSYNLNIISFWASWCGPCVMEIQSTKKMYPIYKAKKIKFSQVSIDANPGDWQDALARLHMAWPQYNVKRGDLKEINNKFSFSNIPTVIFFDKKGKEFMRFSGYDSTTENSMLQTVIPYLK